ncbi:MAG: heavy-metal-associated domain-containing protein [Eubacteriales bacterium]
MTKKIFIEGMSCGHCVARVEKALKALDGVSDVMVDLEGKFAQFQMKSEIDDETLIGIIDDAGYDVVRVE